MIEALGSFVERLRRRGVEASPAELIDATRALAEVGVEERARFRTALGVTLAKTTRQREIFDEVFEEFFTAPARSGGRRRKRRRPSEGEGRGARAVNESGVREVRAGSESERRRRGLPRRLRLEHGDPLRGASEGGRPAHPAVRPLDVPLPTEEERRLAAEVPRQIERLRLRRSRRQRRASSGSPWPRRIFRANQASGGVPFVMPWRRPRRRRPRVVLLIDVSYSVARAAGFFLWMASEFLELGRQARVVLFVNRPVDATDALRAWDPASRPSFTELLKSIPELDTEAASDYGRMWDRLLRSRMAPRGRDTVLLVLGDGRTNRFDPLEWAFEEVSRRTRSVVWLVPEHRGRWGTGDSALERYLSRIDVLVEARTLEGLREGLGELLRRL